MTWLSWGVFASAMLAAAVHAYYVAKYPGSSKWWLRLVTLLGVLYFAVLYLFLGLEKFDLPYWGPSLIRPGIGMLLLLLAADVLFDLVRMRGR
jgi:hypothetical protein